jgi:hypothetical protein
MPVYSNTREACARWPSLAALRIPSILLISRANSYLPAWGSIRRLQRNPELGAHVVEHDSNGLDDQLVRVGLTINNDLVLRLFCSVNVEVMRFGEPVFQPLYQLASRSASFWKVLASCRQVNFWTFSVLD